MKKILGILACLMVVSSVALASPLMDYSAGKASIDLMWSGSQTKMSLPGIGNITGDTKYNLDSAITLGLGNNFALQYRNFEPRGNAEEIVGGYSMGMKTYEINVLHKLDNGLAVFAGIVPTRFLVESEIAGVQETGLGPTKNYWQVGLVGVQNVGPKLKAFERAAAGSKWTNLETGLSYPLGSAVEFNVNYRYIKAKGLVSLPGDGETDATAKGFGYGLTYKF